uniref:Uncharacterized protein n=1 Tax=Heterorhabditis bacteriophora TaxID=37862 RepID=A0A1I7WGQ5_HETBA
MVSKYMVLSLNSSEKQFLHFIVDEPIIPQAITCEDVIIDCIEGFHQECINNKPRCVRNLKSTSTTSTTTMGNITIFTL